MVLNFLEAAICFQSAVSGFLMNDIRFLLSSILYRKPIPGLRSKTRVKTAIRLIHFLTKSVLERH